jgi:hypothetical protein
VQNSGGNGSRYILQDCLLLVRQLLVSSQSLLLQDQANNRICQQNRVLLKSGKEEDPPKHTRCIKYYKEVQNIYETVETLGKFIFKMKLDNKYF